jgi:hypothetical protein
MIAAAGIPLFSNTVPSATLAALHDPQSPMAAMTHVALFSHFVGNRSIYRIREAVAFGAYQGPFDGVPFFDQLTDGGEQRGSVELRIVEQANCCPVKSAESSRGQLVLRFSRWTRGIQERHLVISEGE